MTKIRNSSYYNTDNHHKFENKIHTTFEDSLFQRTCRQMNNAGKIFCNLVSQLWDQIVLFLSNKLPSDREWQFMTVKAQRACSDGWRNLKRLFSDLWEKPSVFTLANRGFVDGVRNVTREIENRNLLTESRTY